MAQIKQIVLWRYAQGLVLSVCHTYTIIVPIKIKIKKIIQKGWLMHDCFFLSLSLPPPFFFLLFFKLGLDNFSLAHLR